MLRKVIINYKKKKKIILVDEKSDWEVVAEYLVSKMEPGTVVALQGDLGAGKTTLTQYIARQLGVAKRALSPTFALIKSYKVQTAKYKELKRLLHLDVYRIEDERELIALELDEELMEPGTVMVVEWPEKIQRWLSRQTNVIHVGIEMKG